MMREVRLFQDQFVANGGVLMGSDKSEAILSNSLFTNVVSGDTRLSNITIDVVSITHTDLTDMTVEGVKMSGLFTAFEKTKG